MQVARASLLGEDKNWTHIHAVHHAYTWVETGIPCHSQQDSHGRDELLQLLIWGAPCSELRLSCIDGWNRSHFFRESDQQSPPGPTVPADHPVQRRRRRAPVPPSVATKQRLSSATFPPVSPSSVHTSSDTAYPRRAPASICPVVLACSSQRHTVRSETPVTSATARTCRVESSPACCFSSKRRTTNALGSPAPPRPTLPS